MTVFKGYLKILNKNKFTVLMYLIIFTILTFVFSQDIESNMSFENEIAPVLWLDRDDTALTRDLKAYLEKYAEYKVIREDQIEDAFFYRDIEMIVEIPKGFTESLKDKEPMALRTKRIPNSSSTFTFESELEKYLNIAHLYLHEEIPVDNLFETIHSHLAKNTEVEFTQKDQSDYTSMMFYFNFLAYILVALIVTVIGVMMYSFKPIEIKRRLHLAKISMKEINLILIISNLFLGFFLYLFLMGLSIVTQGRLMFTTQGLLFSLNAFLFMLNTIALAYMIASLFDSVNIIGALGTICSLGFAFITGVFVPQDFLNDNLLKIARVIPSYWYVRNNRHIATLTLFNKQTIEPLLFNYLIIIITALLFILVAYMVSKWKEQAEH